MKYRAHLVGLDLGLVDAGVGLLEVDVPGAVLLLGLARRRRDLAAQVEVDDRLVVIVAGIDGHFDFTVARSAVRTNDLLSVGRSTPR